MKRNSLTALFLFFLLLLSACAVDSGRVEVPEAGELERVPLRYAQRFTVDALPEGGVLVTIDGGERCVLLPEGREVPEGQEEAVVLRVPMRNLYVADSSAMDFFTCLDALGAVRLSALREADWTLPEPREAMARGSLLYAGKYSAPDYELLMDEGCTLAVENTMIYHSPEVREQLEALGIPVLVSRASYEPHPLGRLEWIKLYGLLTGRFAEAEALFDEQAARVEALAPPEGAPCRVAFFSLSANGYAIVRTAGDYITRMLELAGGESVFSSLDALQDSARATVNLELEQFYALARDADVLIYSASLDGGVETAAQLEERMPWLRECAAWRSGRLWCTRRSLYQQTSGVAGIIEDFHTVILGGTQAGELEYLFHLD